MNQHLYHPEIAPANGVVACDAASRAKARHGVAIVDNRSRHKGPNISPSVKGLDSWDVFLRSTTEPDVRSKFMQDTRDDLHDAAAALDKITSGFTIILHSHGLPRGSPKSDFRPEGMQFTAYITELRSDMRGKYETPIAQIAQIFAGDIMREHCHQYSLQCASSGMPPDLSHHDATPLPPQRNLPCLLPQPYPSTSRYIFQGLPAGILESYLLTRHNTAAPGHRISERPASPSNEVAFPYAARNYQALTWSMVALREIQERIIVRLAETHLPPQNISRR